MTLTMSRSDSLVTESQVLHPLKQKYPDRHCHYSREDFFSFQSQSGTVIDWNDSKTIFAGEGFITSLIEGLEEQVGEASSIVMYSIGKEWGKRDFHHFQKWFELEYPYTLSEVPIARLLEAWWWSFDSQGWGSWNVDLSNQKNGFLFISIFDSAVARTLGDIGKPVCHIYAGLFAGFFSEMVKKPLSCIEIQCYSMGESYCKFLLGKEDRINAAHFWQNEGATAKDIEKRLKNGEFLV